VNDTELYNKAAKAGYDYYMVYGSFPEKIGIPYERLHQFGCTQIIFPEMNPVEYFREMMPDFTSITYRQHVARFEPVLGEKIKWDEVYLPYPGDDKRVISGEAIAYLAHQKERVRIEEE